MSALAVRHGLTATQAEIIHSFVACGNVSEVSTLLKVNDSTVRHTLALPHAQAAIRSELTKRLARAAPSALGVLEWAVRNESVTPRVRVDAAKAILDRAGFVAPRAGTVDGFQKALNEMNTDELRQVVRQLEDKIADRAKLVKTPDSAPDRLIEDAKALTLLD